MKKFQFLKAGDYMKTITRAKYLDRIIELNGTPDIKIITGIRRSGKSKLMQAYIAYGRKKNATDFQKICGVAAWSIFNFHFHNVRGATAL